MQEFLYSADLKVSSLIKRPPNKKGLHFCKPFLLQRNMVAWTRIELVTRGFSIRKLRHLLAFIGIPKNN